MAEHDDFASLAERFDDLPWRDRRAVLHRLTPAERRRFDRLREQATVPSDPPEDRSDGLARAWYSPWLAQLVCAALGKGAPMGDPLPDRLAAALVQAHARVAEQRAPGTVRTGPRSLGDWLRAIIAPGPQGAA